MMIGLGAVDPSFAVAVSICASGSGEVATDGPFGELVLDRRIAGVERDAAFWSALVRSLGTSPARSIVMSERREVKLGLESTR